MSKTITPTIGRRVWYWPSAFDMGHLKDRPQSIIMSNELQPCDAGVVFVHGEKLINITVADHNGNMHKRTSVTLVQPGDVAPASGGYCTWMDYQVDQAKKTETSEVLTKPTDTAVVDAAMDASTETTLVAKGLTAARVTVDDIDELMTRVVYINEGTPTGTTSTFVHAFLDGTFLLATGHSACVSPANFNAAFGLQHAKANAERKAREKLWELEGYALFKRKTALPITKGAEDAVATFLTEDPDHGQG
jgi:hypothetical protein